MALIQPRDFVGQVRGVSHHGQENKTSTNRPDTLTQTFFIHKLFPCSRAADHTLSNYGECGPSADFQTCVRLMTVRTTQIGVATKVNFIKP